MKLYRITLQNETTEREVLIFSESLPSHKKILKHINMFDYAGKEMSNEDYKYFVIELKNYVHYNIEDIEELDFLTIK